MWTLQTYKSHERSRESIEMAFDTILQEKMKVRHKMGFRPPKRGRKTDLDGDAPVHILLYSSSQSLHALEKRKVFCSTFF